MTLLRVQVCGSGYGRIFMIFLTWIRPNVNKYNLIQRENKITVSIKKLILFKSKEIKKVCDCDWFIIFKFKFLKNIVKKVFWDADQ